MCVRWAQEHYEPARVREGDHEATGPIGNSSETGHVEVHVMACRCVGRSSVARQANNISVIGLSYVLAL